MKIKLNVIGAIMVMSIAYNTTAEQSVTELTQSYRDQLVTPASSTAPTASIPKRSLFIEDNLLYLVDVEGQEYEVPIANIDLSPSPLLEFVDETVVIQAFDQNTLEMLDTTYITLDLPIYAGFYATDDFYFTVSGQSQRKNISIENGNITEKWLQDANLKVIQINKYDKAFKLLDSAAIRADEASITSPFQLGNVALTSHNNMLLLHTARTMFSSASGVHHQAQFTAAIDTNSMLAEVRLAGASRWAQPNNVSHSFNQFAAFDDNQAILLDHGNAFPRALVITQYDHGNALKDDSINIFDIPGYPGATQTGLTVGGFAISDHNYITAINSIDYQPKYHFSNSAIVGLTKEERDIVVLVTSKESSNTTQVALTDYSGTNTLGSTPKLVDLNNNTFMVMWMEFTDCQYIINPDNSITTIATDSNLQYVTINEYGTKLSDVQTFEDGKLSQFVQPIATDDKVIWVAGENYYSIDF